MNFKSAAKGSVKFLVSGRSLRKSIDDKCASAHLKSEVTEDDGDLHSSHISSSGKIHKILPDNSSFQQLQKVGLCVSS